MSRIDRGFDITMWFLVNVLLLPFYPLFWVVGWADDVLYKRSVRRETQHRTRGTP